MNENEETISLAEVMLAVYRSTDVAWANHLTRFKRPVSCSRGCSACCELQALITWPEALPIAEQLRAEGRVAEVAPALVEQARAASFDGVNALTYFQRHIRCALLDADGSCSVYASRPVPCRYHVVLSPAALCAVRDPTAPTEAVDNADVFHSVLLPILRDLDVNHGMGREAYICAPIPVMVLAALKEMGEPVEIPIDPREWLRRYGEEVWKHQRGSRKVRVRQEGT